MWVLVRIAGIIVGIATLLRLATTQGLVTYDPLFQEWMDRLQDLVELGFLTDLIEPLLHRFIDWMRSFGLHLPDLNDNWRPVFILSSLYLGAEARQLEGDLIDRLFNGALVLLCAFMGAAIAGLSTGPAIIAGFIFALSLNALVRAFSWALVMIRAAGDFTEEVFQYWALLALHTLSTSAIAIASLFPSMRWTAVVPVVKQIWDATNSGRLIGEFPVIDPILFSSARYLMMLERLILSGIFAAAFLVSSLDAPLLILFVIAVIGFSAILRAVVGVIGIFGSMPRLFVRDRDGNSVPLEEVPEDNFQSFKSALARYRDSGMHVLYSALDILAVLLGSLAIASIFASAPIW